MRHLSTIMRRFFAFLTILSVTFTQVCPAWALRTESGGSLTVRAGLEENLRGKSVDTVARELGSMPPVDWEGVAAQARAILKEAPNRQPRPIRERIKALTERFGDFASLAGTHNLSGSARELVWRLGNAVSKGVLTLDEAADPMLSLTLLAPRQKRLLHAAAGTVAEWEHICPNCGEHALHEKVGSEAGLDLEAHGFLHLLSGVASAMDLFLLGGKLRSVEVSGVDHRREIARTAQTVQWLHSLGGAGSVSGREIKLSGTGVMGALAGAVQEAPVVALVTHPSTPGQELDHYLLIESMNMEHDAVVVLDRGERRTLSLTEFRGLHGAASDRAVLFLTSAQRDKFQQLSRPNRGRDLNREALLNYCGACGIIVHVGRFSQEGGFSAAIDAAYRGKDNFGEIIVNRRGLRRSTVQGAPSQMVRLIQLEGQGHPEEAMALYLEANPSETLPEDLRTALQAFAEDRSLDPHQRFLIHQKWRSLSSKESRNIERISRGKARRLADRQGINWVYDQGPVSPYVADRKTQQRRLANKDDLYHIDFYGPDDEPVRQRLKSMGHVRMDNVIGRGKQGHIWSGRWRDIEAPTETQPFEDWRKSFRTFVQDLRGDYRYDLNYIRELLRVELADRLEKGHSLLDSSLESASDLEAVFIRLFEQMAAGNDLKPADQDLWKKIWSILGTKDLPIRISGHVSPDAVRHAFRLQERLVSAIRHNPEWSASVQAFFVNEIPDDHRKPGDNWYSDWKVEQTTNTPLNGFVAITAWFQKVFIPADVWLRYGMELGQMDAITIGYLAVVDRILRHDRWATTGSRNPKDAQPLTDTGLLSGISDETLAGLVTQASNLTRREIIRQKKRTGGSLSDERKTGLLREQFGRVLRAHLKRHPEDRGEPMRGYAHNGDLDPNVQNRILEILKENGYGNEFMQIDPRTGRETLAQILTDTWKLVALQEYIYDAYRKDKALGLVVSEGPSYLKSDEVGFMPPAYRRLWNEIQTTMKTNQFFQRQMNRADEISRRIALLEFSEGILTTKEQAKEQAKEQVNSEIALGWVSQYDPFTDAVVSHRRSLEVVFVRNEDGKDYQVQYTSDALTAVRMVDVDRVEQVGALDARIAQEYQTAIDKIASDREKGMLKDDQEALQLSQLLVALKAVREESYAKLFQAELSITLKGAQKYLTVEKEWTLGADGQERFVPVIVITDFRGYRLGKIYWDARSGRYQPDIISSEEKNIKVHPRRDLSFAATTKGGFPTFGLKEISSQLGALVEMRVHAGVQRDDPASLNITREGLSQTASRLVELQDPKRSEELRKTLSRYVGPDWLAPAQTAAGLEEGGAGLNREALKGFILRSFEAGKRGVRGKKRHTGVGSSENMASAARGIFRWLLPFLDYDMTTPARLISTAAHDDPEITYATGDTWSGSTALTLLALEWLRSQGVLVAGLTGNPTVKDIADVVESSAGTIHARTKKEVAVYTTVGFLMMLEGAFEEAIQMNLIAQEEAPDDTTRQLLKGRLDAIYGDYYGLVDHLRFVLSDPARQFDDSNSILNQFARHIRKMNGFLFIGDYYNNPILDELGIKFGETRNVNFTSYDFDSSRYEALEKYGVDSNRGWFLNATSMNRIQQATRVLWLARQYGKSIAVQTFNPGTVQFTDEERTKGYDKHWAEFLQELEGLEKDFDGKAGEGGTERPLAVRFLVPRVHFTIQPFLDVITGQLLGVMTALESGMSIEATDGPRNLAKSVTVKGVGLPGALMTVADYVEKSRAEDTTHLNQQRDAYAQGLQSRWSDLKNPQDKGLQRLPLRMDELLERFDAGSFTLNEQAVSRTFGTALHELRRIVLLVNQDEGAEIAARMAELPLSNSEVVLSDSAEDALFLKAKDRDDKYKPSVISRTINGKVVVLRFERSPGDQQPEKRTVPHPENRILIRFEEDEEDSDPVLELSGDERGILQALSARQGVGFTLRDSHSATLMLAGREYLLKVLGDKGISLTASQPELLGVPVSIHRPSDFTLDEDIDSGTLVVAMGRANHRGADESVVVSIESAVNGRSASQKQEVQKISEDHQDRELLETVRRLRERRTPVFTIGDEETALTEYGSAGRVVLDSADVDSNSAVLSYYAALLQLGAQLGQMRGIAGAQNYALALRTLPTLVAQTLDSLYTEEVETGNRLSRSDVEYLELPFNRQVYRVSYEPKRTGGGIVNTGTVRVWKRDEEQSGALKIPVLVEDGKVSDLPVADQTLEIAGVQYRLRFSKTRGLVFRRTQPDFVGGGTVRDQMVALRQNRHGSEQNLGKQYGSWLDIGGVQDRANAAAAAYAKEQHGFQSQHREVDESVHGPLALVDDMVEKFTTPFWREGVNPDYDPDSREDGSLERKDVGTVVFALDTFSAAIVDAQRIRTRNGRIILVVRESDRDKEGVVNSGAHLILTVPNTFTAFTSFQAEVVARVLAQELRRSEDREYAYQPGSVWAERALLPKVQMRGGESAHQGDGLDAISQERLESWIEQKKGSFTVLEMDQFGQLLHQARTQPGHIATEVVSDPGGNPAIFSVFPYAKADEAGLNPTPHVLKRIAEITQTAGTRYSPIDVFISTFNEPEIDGPIQWGLLWIPFDTRARADVVMARLRQELTPFLDRTVLGPVPEEAAVPLSAEEQLVQDLVAKHEVLPGVYMAYAAGQPSTGQTTFAISAPQDTARIAVLLMNPLAEIGVSFRHSEIEAQTSRGPISVSLAIANIAPDQLNVPHPGHGERNVIQEIERRIIARAVQLKMKPASLPTAPPVAEAPPAAPIPPLTAPTMEQFRAEVQRTLSGFPEPSAVGDIAGAVVAGFQKSTELPRRPQVLVFEHPRDPNQAVVAIVDKQRDASLWDTVSPILKQAGADVSHHEENLVGNTVFVFFEVNNMSWKKLRKAEPKIGRAVEGRDVPDGFKDFVKPYLPQMPEAPLPSIYGAYVGLQADPRERGLALATDNVPDRSTQTALSAIVRKSEFPNLDSEIRDILRKHGLQIVQDPNAPGGEMAFALPYKNPENPTDQEVLFSRYVVDSPVGDPGVLSALADIENLVSSNNEKLLKAVERPAIVGPGEPLPGALQGHEPEVGITGLRDQWAEEMHQAFLADPYQGIHFKAAYDSTTNQTVLVVVAEEGQPNLVATVSTAIANARLSLGPERGSLRDHPGEDIEYFIMPGEVSADIIQEIQRKLSATVTLHFRRAIVQVLPLSSMDEISSYFQDFRSASEEGVAFVSRLDEGTSISEQFVFSFAVRGLAETAPQLLQVRQAVQEIFSLNNLTVGDAMDFEYQGVRIFHGKVAGFATEGQVRAAEEQINEALTPFKAGLEETLAVATAPRISPPVLVSVPAVLREIVGGQAGQLPDVRQEMGIYGSVFVDPAGLAVGVSLQTARLPDGSLAPQRFVVANEAQEEVLLQVLAPERQGDIVRAWEHGGVQGAMDYAGEQLRAQNLIVQTVRPQNVAAILPELRELMQLLAVTHYDAEFAAKVAQQVYNLFV